ncbi:thiol reductant ABC exporter subunit CydD [Vagococcus carniphilus]|uniref:Thiol reductant ABC exporter subunit CydD n=1 Tax=Vagococcus carniphilus TaxID=218144 RepID=A0AAW8U3B9_9ENTE|nr:thiol reductant ABC exporter subunit CydD [Vagococcus carniphilus]MDT2831824.1 thiol reductant ABC exporter subunit CydD [Vagococcus carniphilus]MDT2834095.1 thiol reductant ABC exporter subunit CydD [Vagococcus carniphilus]MDT2840677.1 thiol reductant ABC exporter subunit CydD [Vagococcus carniphilus]MDT2855334.1 thiol reductant ABC exporter subunit CydD [Vagococcus carniphilus]
MIDKNLFRIDKARPVLIGLAGLGVLQALLIIGQAYFLSKAISALWNGSNVASQITEMGIFFICFLLRQVLNFLRDRYLDSYAYEQSKVVRQELLDKVFRLGPNFVQKEGTGNMVTMAIEGIAQVENYLTLILPKITNMMVIPWVILIFVFTQDIRSGVILLLVFPIIILFMIILGYAARAKADRQYEGYQLLSNHFLDSLRGLETLNFLGLSKKYEKNVYGISEDYRKATMSTLKIAILSTFALDFFTTLSVAIVAVFLGFKLMNGEMMLFPALTTLILAPDFFLPLRDFSSDYHATLDGGNTLKSIFNILDKKEFEEQEDLSLGAWSEADSLDLTGLTLKYDEEATKKTLEDINFSWKGYGKIGVVGLSGSGKSTLIKLLGGFLEAEEPSIRVNSQLTNHLRLKSWQDQLLYVPQDPYIFHASLKDNIRFYQPQASERDILIAVEQAGLLEVVKDLPEGLETVIGEGAHALSGGQLQRVAIARAFLDNNRQILLFDEPTAHLDVETEAELKSTMLPLFENHLVFFATHRLHWMKEMDYILVMKDGQIVEQGTYTELRQKKGAYHEFVEQLKGE